MENDQSQSTPTEVNKQELSENRRLLLAKRLRGLSGSKGADRIERRLPELVVPLSAEQRRVWLHASQQPDSAIYNEPITIQKLGSFSLEILNASLDEMVRRHEAWRTSFAPDGTSLVHPPLHVQVPFTDLASLPAGLREEEALRVATVDAQQPLSLEKPPLFRARVVKLDAQDHRLYLTLHHIIFDGVSLAAILLPELAAIYEAFEQGKPSPLPDPGIQYGDYALWREQQLKSPALANHLKYWSRQLGGELPVLRLPLDRPRPAMPTYRGTMERFTISDDLTSSLRAFCRDHGVTMYMVLLAAYKVLLFRYSGQEDVIVGTAVDARRHADLKQVMGYFLDTVAIRTKPFEAEPFLEYLFHTRDVVLDAFTNSDIPFDRVVHEVNPKRDSSHHPIFQAFFSMRPLMTAPPSGWGLRHLDVAAGAVKFDIYLELGEQPTEVEGRILYSSDLFYASSVKRMEGHLLTLLRSICETPEKPLGRLPILNAEEREALLGTNGWNATARNFPAATLQTLIQKRVQETPDAVAAVFNDKQLTYRALDARSIELANSLISAGAVPGGIVAIALERSLDLVAGLLAVLRIGAAYLPLDVLMSRERVAQCLAHAEPAAVLTQDSLFPMFDQINVKKVLVGESQETVTGASILFQARSELNVVGSVSDTAYVIYTSGTTGEPKAVEISHEALVNLLTSMQREPGFDSRDVLLAVTPISFDIAALELFVPLISGGTVVLATREEVQDPYLLAKAIQGSGCTVLQATPATWRTLLRSGWTGVDREAQAGKLRILCGGESMTPDLGEQLLATGAEVWNMYGPTETTIWSLTHRVSTKDAGYAHSVSVGGPIANTTAYILDRGREFVPVGVPGDLFLGGTGLAKGYRGEPKKTADRFFRVEAVNHSLLYHTGDLAVRRADGTIVILGRTDNQVKIRGYRVELEAVEAAALKHPKVSAAAARAWPEATGDMRLGIYLVGISEGAPDLGELRSFLISRLPEYMIPSYVVALESLPLSSNGKVDRSRLSAPATETQKQPQRSPTSPEEAAVGAIWAALLGVESVEKDDDFFALGGHSILVAELQQSILSTFGTQIPMSGLFHQPTVRLQAELLRRARGDKQELSPGVLQLQSQGAGTPLFWVHFASEGLSKAVGVDQPFFSILLTNEDVVSLGGRPTLREIAALHLAKIRSIQPHGPYCLGGFCVGGVIAYEAAVLLQGENETTAKLVLVDAPNPNPAKLKRFFRYSRWILGTGGWKALGYSLEKRLDDVASILRKRREARNEMRTAQEIIEGATSRYHPGRYRGDVLLVQASDRLHMDLLPPWKDIISEKLQTKYVDGHHDDLMKAQNVGDVGAVIREYLRSKKD